MSARTRVIVMSITAPVVAFAILGGFLGKVMAREETYQHLRIFDDVVGMIANYYVEEADMDKASEALEGAAHAESLVALRDNLYAFAVAINSFRSRLQAALEKYALSII